jgi:hypothetical protein
MNKLTPYIKDYDYLFLDKIPRTHENFKAIKKENDLFQYSKTVQLVNFTTFINSIESYFDFGPSLKRRFEHN